VTNEERVKTLFAQANPIPDADLFDLDEIDGTAYLATLEARSSEMTQLETKGQDQKEKKTATPWLIAAAVAIVAGIGLIVVNQGEEAFSEAPSGELDGVWWEPRLPDVSLDIPIVYQIGPGDLFVFDGRAQLTSPVFQGSYTFIDGEVTYFGNQIADGPGVPGLGPCPTGGGDNRWKITIVDDGEIGTEVVAAGGCSGRVGHPVEMVRLSPSSTAGETIAPPEGEYDDSFQFPSQLNGIWLREGTGEVVYFHSADSTYGRSDIGDVVVAPQDRGTFVLVPPEDDAGQVKVVFTSDGTGKCSAGSTMTWDSVQWNQVPPAIDPPLGPIGAVLTIADDACGISSGSQTWIHVAGA